jgi:peptidoglycan/LPS O-acetylase OafA/YrhL
VLDGVRTLCVLAVALFHVWQQSWLTPTLPFGLGRLDVVVRSGYIFVDGLILLSGFLLFLPYARQKVEGGALPLAKDFFLRRAARIVPSYYFCVLAVLLFEALPQGKYSSAGAMWQDLITHLTFTHTLTPLSYVGTHLNGALWTLGVEVQAYALFPLLARAFSKRPPLISILMVGAAFCYRGLVQAYVKDTSMYVNQLPAFLDVYALGMLSAWAYVTLASKFPRPRAFMQLAATVTACIAAYAVFLLMKTQASSSGYEVIRITQMNQRFLLAAAMAAFMLGLSFSFRALRFLFSNRVMRFLSAISFNYYMWHQMLAVWLKSWHIPAYASPNPNRAAEQPWQTQYTILCFILALLLASALTYGLEKPAAALVHKIFHRRPKGHERPADDSVSA